MAHWLPIARAGLTIWSNGGIRDAVPRPRKRIHDYIRGFGVVSKSGKSIAWDSGWKPLTKKEIRKREIARERELKAQGLWLPKCKRVFPQLIRSEIVAIQPMKAPIGIAMYAEFRYEKR